MRRRASMRYNAKNTKTRWSGEKHCNARGAAIKTGTSKLPFYDIRTIATETNKWDEPQNSNGRSSILNGRLFKIPQIFPNPTNWHLYEVSKVAETVCKITKWTICEYSWVQCSYLASKDTLLTFSCPHFNPLPFLSKYWFNAQKQAKWSEGEGLESRYFGIYLYAYRREFSEPQSLSCDHYFQHEGDLELRVDGR